jgi:hypothetical protein
LIFGRLPLGTDLRKKTLLVSAWLGGHAIRHVLSAIALGRVAREDVVLEHLQSAPRERYSLLPARIMIGPVNTLNTVCLGLEATRIILRESPDCNIVIVTQNDATVACEQPCGVVDVNGFVKKSDLTETCFRRG